MADTHVKHDTLNKELVAVVGSIKRNGATAHATLEITEDMIAVLTELKRVIRLAESWVNIPDMPNELIVKNSVEYAVLLKLRQDTQKDLDAQAAKLAKKSRRT
jgi:hypothetical protein